MCLCEEEGLLAAACRSVPATILAMLYRKPSPSRVMASPSPSHQRTSQRCSVRTCQAGARQGPVRGAERLTTGEGGTPLARCCRGEVVRGREEERRGGEARRSEERGGEEA